MKLLFDQNLSPRLASSLADLFPNSAHVAALDLDRADDREIVAFARREGFAIVTKDADFDDLRLLLPDAPRIIWVQLGNCSTQDLEHLLRQNADAIQALGADPTVTLLSLR
ncbi:MAG: DUF5615 family PIN-like protein [Bacteroidota bacterium]